jgi:hypothetical protein
MDYEIILLTKIIEEGCIREVIDEGFNRDFIVNHRPLWNELLKSYRKHGVVLPVEEVRSRYPEFEFINSDVNVSFVIDELRKRRTHGLVADGLQKQVDCLKGREPDQAIEVMRQIVAMADVRQRSKDVNIIEYTEERVKDYEAIVNMGGVTGLPTLWSIFDESTGGIQNTDLYMIAGRSKTGKSWLEVVLALHHWSLGHVPLILSREMSVRAMVRRCDAVLSQLSYDRFKRGMLTVAEKERWLKTLETMKKGRPFYISGEDEGRLTVSGVSAKIEKYDPAITYIDGAYLIEDENGARMPWERFSNVCRDLHFLTLRRRKPIIVTHQFNLEGKDDKGTGDTLKFGDVKMWFDVMLGIYQDDVMRENREMLFKTLKNREGPEVQWVSNWDLDSMNFDTKQAKGGIASGSDTVNDTPY